MGIEEGAGADEVAEAEEAAGDGVPKRDGIIANQIGEGLLAPFLVGVEDEFFVSGGGWDGGAVLFEFAAEIVAAVEADVADEPEAAIEGARLLRGLRGGAGAEEGEDEAGAGLRGDVGGVRATEG